MAERELLFEMLGGGGYQAARNYIKDSLAKANIKVDLGGIELSDVIAAALGFLGYSQLSGPIKSLVQGVLVVSVANIIRDAVDAIKKMTTTTSTSSGSQSGSSGSSVGTRSYSGATEQYAIVRVLR